MQNYCLLTVVLALSLWQDQHLPTNLPHHVLTLAVTLVFICVMHRTGERRLSPQQQFVKALTDGDLQALKDLHALEPRLVKQLITTNYGDDVDPLSHAISQGVRPLETGKAC
jgi:hypothetical protein